MTHDLCADSPEERIERLEQENAELRMALAGMVHALGELRPALVAVHEAMEGVGQTQYEAGLLLDKLEKESSQEVRRDQ